MILTTDTAKADNLKVTTIDLLRHGQCEDGHCYRGHADVSLSQEGWQQMESGLAALADDESNWQRIITSPLVRCFAFAHELALQNELPVSKHNELRELNFGEWEGQLIEHVWQTQQEQVIAWGNDPVAYPPPGGESADIFAERVTAILLDLLESHAGEHWLLISHGGVMRVLLSYCLSMPLLAMNKIDIPYACVSRLQVFTEDGKHHFRLCGHNMALAKNNLSSD